MVNTDDFQHRLELKVSQQLKSQRVAFLMGAGSAYLDGKGYPLTSQLWEAIRDSVPGDYRTDIQSKLDNGAKGVEEALDLLDDGGVCETPHRHSVTEAITAHFQTLAPPLDTHINFLKCLSRRTDHTNTIFSLNYDPLLERAAEVGKIRLVDGFFGFEDSYFEPALFQESSVVITKGYKGPQYRLVPGIIKLIKLHGSLGWYDCPTHGIRRCRFDAGIPAGTKRLMIPPQHRKAVETTTIPYAVLWSEFRGMLRYGPHLMNRLVTIGYSMSDEHVNSVIENALARTDFTLMVFAKELMPEMLARWATKHNVIIITNNNCSLYGEKGPGHAELWNFERLCKEM